MATLNQLGSKISNILGKPVIIAFKRELKMLVRHSLLLFIRQSIERNGVDEVLKVSFNVPLICVPLTDIEKHMRGIGAKDMVLTTEHRVPTPLRMPNDAPFFMFILNMMMGVLLHISTLIIA